MVQHTKRRGVLKLTGLAVAGTSVVGTASASSSSFSGQLNGVRAATRRYRDVGRARDDGYRAVSPYVPGMGFHFGEEFPPFGTDREDPPILVYFTDGSYDPSPDEMHDRDRDSDLVLGAVEYAVPGDQSNDPPNIFADEGTDRNLRASEEHGWHYEKQVDFTELHAWVHRGNPAGVFHSTNPQIE